MSWMDDIEREFKYRCGECGGVSLYTLKQTDPGFREDHPCENCGSPALYDGFLPIKMHLRGKVAFDQNGRKAYAITDGKGNVRYTSASKEHYYETGDIKPHYTPAYEEHLRKTGNVEQLETIKHAELIKRRRETKEFAKTLRPKLTEGAAKKEDRP